jgi:LacI family transcriptional regulator
MVDRPTISDLAKAAGVSIATVDRVLNRRLPVRGDTAQRVVQAAEQIGFHATSLLRKRVFELPSRRFGFLLQKKNVFYQALGVTLNEASLAETRFLAKPMVEHVDELEPETIVARMMRMAAKVDALTVVAVDHPIVNDAVNALVDRGKPVFCAVSDLSALRRSGYVGADKRKSGRAAGWLISKIAQGQGKVGIVLGTHRYLSQESSEISFRSFMREFAPNMTMLEPVLNFDDDVVSYKVVSQLIAQEPDLVGIYNAGGGQEGMIRALRDSGAGSRIAVVCNELIAETRSALIDGAVDMVIGTPIQLLSRKVVEMMGVATHAIEGSYEKLNLYPPELIISETV